MGTELFSRDANGKPSDEHLHEETDDHVKAFSRMAIHRAIAEGMKPELAVRLYGTGTEADAEALGEHPVSHLGIALTPVSHDPFAKGNPK